MIPNYDEYRDAASKSDFIFTDLDVTYREIPKNEIFSLWDSISSFVVDAIQYSPEEICSGDVYMKLMTDNTCHLFVLEKDGIKGIIVCYVIEGRMTKTLKIWLLGGKPRIFMDAGKVVFNIARRNKCSNIIASSTRKGMQKALSFFGFKEKLISYEMSL